MKVRARLALLAMFVWLMAPISTTAQNIDGCTSSKCHSNIGGKEWVHGPVGVGACKVCHNPVSEKDHTFALAAERAELCSTCHDRTDELKAGNRVHAPLAEGDCLSCHDPHQADYRYFVRQDSDGLCFTCHDRVAYEEELIHGPNGVGDCNACHNPHSSVNAQLLIAPRKELCTSCHKGESSSRMTLAEVHR